MEIISEIIDYAVVVEAYVPSFPNLPVISTITGYIDSAVGDIYKKIIDKKFDDRIKAINKIISLNNDSTA